MWTLSLGLYANIKQWWSIDVDGTTMFRATKKLASVKTNILKWNKSSCGHIFQSRCKLKGDLDNV